MISQRSTLMGFFEKSIDNEFDYKQVCLSISVGSSQAQSYIVTAWSRDGISLKNTDGPHRGYLRSGDSAYWELIGIKRVVPSEKTGFKSIVMEII